MLSSGWSLRTLVSIVGFAVVIWLALLPVVPSSLPLSDGDISTRTIRAPHDISFTSKALTEKRQEEASEAIKDSFVYDPSVASNQQAQLTTLLGRIRFILSDSATAPAARDAGLANVEKLSLSPATRAFLARMQPNDFTRIETEARRALASIYDQSVSSEFVQEVRERANTYVSSSLDRDESNLVTEIIRPFIVTTLVIDKDRSQVSRAGGACQRRAGAGDLRQGPGHRRKGLTDYAGGARGVDRGGADRQSAAARAGRRERAAGPGGRRCRDGRPQGVSSRLRLSSGPADRPGHRHPGVCR